MLNAKAQTKENKKIYNYILDLYLSLSCYDSTITNVENDGKIVKFNLDPRYLNQFIELVKGEIVENVEGCLLDHYLIYSSLGTIVVHEHYLNCWSSDYRILIQESNGTELELQWWEFYDKYTEKE